MRTRPGPWRPPVHPWRKTVTLCVMFRAAAFGGLFTFDLVTEVFEA